MSFPWEKEIQMYPTHWKSPFYHLLVGLSITISITLPCLVCSSHDDPKYTNCTQPFKCGDPSVLGELKYPFWGINRGNYCGTPGHELKCINNTPFINISKVALQVVGSNLQSQNIRVATAMFRDSLCPSVVFSNTYINDSIDGFNSISPFLDSTVTLVTILYGCPLNLRPLLSWSGQNYSCSINNTRIDVHFVTHTADVSLASECKGAAMVPILQQSAQALDANTTTLPDALNKGFDLDFGIKNTDGCNTCVVSGGQCGYNNLAQNGFVCYCPDKPYPLECPRSKQGRKSSGTIVGVSIGAVVLVFLLLLGGGLLFTRRRRNQLVAQDKSRAVFDARVSSNDGGGPHASTPGSNGLTSSQDYTNTPSTFSQTTASYMSSRSDIGKSTYFGVHVFDYIELEHATNNFDESKELGDGGFGTVYYGVLPDGRQVAVKRLYENSFKRVEQYINEIRILAEIKHRNLVALYGCTSKKSRELLLVYEFVANGTVADHLHGKLSHPTFLRWPARLNIAVETAEALSFLHRKEVIHRDVKTTNILLDEHFHVKVGDFGLSRLFPTDMTHVSTAPQGTPGYVDPEYYHCYRLTEKSDVYSFGVVLIELISSKQAVDITRHRHDVNLASMAVDRIQNCALHELVDPRLDFDKDLAVQSMVKMVAELGFQCLQPDREMRPTMDEVLARLKAVQLGDVKEQKQEVVDIIVYADDIGLLTAPTPPLSPELPRSNDVV